MKQQREHEREMSNDEDLLIWGRDDDQTLLAARCGYCGGDGRKFVETVEFDDCEHCQGLGWFGIDPELPVLAEQGSTAKVAMLAVRYVSGVVLFNPQDGPQHSTAISATVAANGNGPSAFRDRVATEMAEMMTAAEVEHDSNAPERLTAELAV